MNTLKCDVAFSKLTHAARARFGLSGTTYGPFTAYPSTCHEHNTLQLTPPTSPSPTPSADRTQCTVRYALEGKCPVVIAFLGSIKDGICGYIMAKFKSTS